METIGEYLTRLMRQKNVRAKELARLCGVTNSYIGRLGKSTKANLTVDTMVKLAKALNVNAHEIFTAASGVPASEAAPPDPLVVLDSMQKLLTDASGFEALRQLLVYSPNERKALFDYVEVFTQPPAKRRGKSRKKSKARKK